MNTTAIAPVTLLKLYRRAYPLHLNSLSEIGIDIYIVTYKQFYHKQSSLYIVASPNLSYC